MDCYYCGSHKTAVTDSRRGQEGNTRNRRYECKVCHRRFSTVEIPVGDTRPGRWSARAESPNDINHHRWRDMELPKVPTLDLIDEVRRRVKEQSNG